MGIQDLQALIESEGVSVDLFRIGRNHSGGFRLVLDAEGCLDRLYGGYFSDWACGGQWARCVQFLTTLASALAEHRVAFCVCFNGAHPAPPAIPSHWLQQQAIYRQRANSVLKHIATKGTPPPKVWWIPPIGLHSCLRTALRYLNIPIMVSSDDHHQEVVGLCRERGYAGLVGCSGEYLVFQPPRYFSSSLLKLTYRSSLETKEYLVHDLPKMLEVPQDRLCLAAALLGNTILTEQNLYEFYKKLGYVQKKVPFETLIKSVCKYVRELPSSDIEAACVDIFGDVNDHRAAKLKQSVQYYVNGTKDGFLKYKTATARRPKNNKKNNQKQESPQQTVDLDTSKLASDTSEQEQKGLEDYKLATANASLNPDISMEEQTFDSALKPNPQIGQDKPSLGSNGVARAAGSDKPAAREGKKNANKTVSLPLDTCPSAPAEVLRTCAERHTRGLMSPQLLSVLTHRHLTLPVLLEDDNHREIPSIHHFYRPIRQNVYAILFNMHHHRFMAQKSKEGEQAPTSTVHVSEWIYMKQNPGKSPELVPGVMLDWPVPTVQRLWFGTAQDDKRRRLRAFLSCMRSDSPLMLNTSCVPQHLLILATVLRYIMTSQVQVLRRQELDAFLATAFSNDLMNPLHLQEMTVSGVSLRGVQLASLVMAGAEAALLANDACGAPVPWLVAAPWLYADGKLLQRKLARAAHCKHLLQLCDNQVETVIKVERMRKAILEGLDVEFAMPPLPMTPNMLSMGYGPGGVLGWSGAGRAGRSAGARLEIAGVVVGQWGGGSYAASRQPRYASQVSYVGYTPPPRNAYGGRGWTRGGGAARRGRRPAPPKGKRGAAGVARRKDDAPARAATLTVNGKTVRSEDVTFGLNGNEGGDAGQDSSGDNREGDGEGENGERIGDAGDQGSNLNQQGKPLKVGKNGKKYIPKGKRKNAPQKTDTAHTLDSNGTVTDKKKLPTKSLTSPMFNGANASGMDAAHLGQGDAPIDN